MRAPLLITLVLLLPIPSHAQKKTVVDSKRPMSISYGSPSWNTDSTKIDSAFLVMRDKATGKIVQIQLEETEPDSSEFRGRFSVSLGDTEKVEPEIYVPPANMRGGEKDYRKLYDSIQKGTLIRKPVIWKKNDKGQAVIDVYDTREQAAAALQAYQEQQKIASEMKKNQLLKPIPSEQSMEAAKQLERKKALDKLAMEAAQRESDRVRLEQIEKQKAEERERQAKALSEKERTARRAQAASLAEEGLALFNQGDFVGAEGKFKEATDIDPENKEHYFKYGVALYRNGKFNEALVILNLAKVEPAREMERRYFMGLCHYRLNEFDKSLALLEKVAASNDKDMAPSSQFYIGLIQFAQENYAASKKAFETVIDTSGDPRMDEQAEDYLDRIASALIYQKLREKKWTLTGIVGAMYDSNVLLSADNSPDQGTATNVSDFRLLTIGQADYRPIFSEHHEFAPGVNLSMTNSAKTASAPADPYLVNVYAPYSYKGILFNKGYKGSIKPAYENLVMDSDADGKKSSILNSYIITFDNTFVMDKNWFSTYTLEYRADDTTTADSKDDEDSDANKISLRTVQMSFLDKAKKEVIMGNLGYVINGAKGKNKRYNRIEFGSTYVRPTNWGASWSLGLSAYKLNYNVANPSREDLNVTFTTGISKPVREWVTWGVIGSYTKNNSNSSEYTYSKYMILTTATFTTNF
ncbi:MAG: tetratricopeptide repeat protein [Bdellovibrionales bacterium]|nr:tetratricopeptide repeat protein [Bdellovibrionales bacterium]